MYIIIYYYFSEKFKTGSIVHAIRSVGRKYSMTFFPTNLVAHLRKHIYVYYYIKQAQPTYSRAYTTLNTIINMIIHTLNDNTTNFIIYSLQSTSIVCIFLVQCNIPQHRMGLLVLLLLPVVVLVVENKSSVKQNYQFCYCYCYNTTFIFRRSLLLIIINMA